MINCTLYSVDRLNGVKLTSCLLALMRSCENGTTSTLVFFLSAFESSLLRNTSVAVSQTAEAS